MNNPNIPGWDPEDDSEYQEITDPEYNDSEYIEEEPKDPEPKKSKFKEKWNSKDETCPSCGQVTRISKGLTKQNLMRLIGLKIKMSDFLTLLMLVLVFFLAYAYYNETKTCRDFLSNMGANCAAYEGAHNLSYNPFLIGVNSTNLTINNGLVNDSGGVNESGTNVTIANVMNVSANDSAQLNTSVNVTAVANITVSVNVTVNNTATNVSINQN